MTRTDAELIAAAQAGDRDAFGELMDRHRRLAYKIAGQVGLRRELLDDAVQDAALSAWRTVGNYDPARGQFTTWWGTYAWTAAVNRRRLEVRHDRASLDGVPDWRHPAGNNDDPAAELIAAETAATIDRWRGRLKPAERVVVDAVCRDGLTQDETAARCGVSRARVHQRLIAARKKLARALAPVGA